MTSSTCGTRTRPGCSRPERRARHWKPTAGGWASRSVTTCRFPNTPGRPRCAARTPTSVSAFASGNEHRAAVHLAARALENTVYSVFANPVGGPATRPTRGGSVVYAPDGTLVAGAGTEREGTILADLDPNRMAEIRGFLRMLDEQRARLSRTAAARARRGGSGSPGCPIGGR